MNKKSNLLIILLSLILVGLFWALVFVGKDEFAEFQRETKEYGDSDKQAGEKHVEGNNKVEKEREREREREREGEGEEEEAIKTVQRVFNTNGFNTIQLSIATQQNSGITTAKLNASNFANTSSSTGLVLAIDSLIAANANMLNLSSNASIARAASQHNIVQYQRVKALNADDKNVSDKVVQDALALVNADKGTITANNIQLKNLQSQVKLEWGEQLAQLAQPASNAKLAPYLAELQTRKNVLVQVNLPVNAATPAAGSVLKISPINDANYIDANYISPARKSDAVGYKTYYYSAPAEFLREGMRVTVASKTQAKAGVIIPNSAVVWYGGMAWAYFKSGQDQFVRKAITTDSEVDGGWANTNIEDNAEVVTSGAQLLLSEEFKYQIKNENED